MMEVTIKSPEGDYGRFVCPASADVGDELLVLLKRGRGSFSVALLDSAFKLKLPNPKDHIFVVLNHYTDKPFSSSRTSSSPEESTAATICAIPAPPEANGESIKQSLQRFFTDEKYRIADLKPSMSLSLSLSPPPLSFYLYYPLALWTLIDLCQTNQPGVTPIGAVSRAAIGVKMQSNGQGTFWGSVK